ncbi:DUF2877 domain-containing protein [Paenibacillus sp. ISL-20]|uniref:DUF2877 domain-containing protein n=1 Tax=Paenibacillus sp. ISL-20 TaxID=2819163 RepID=UPI001BEB2835|nr:DUF2877 domain-containing protein [Paenibacillus sp. ISL-20]MBT2765939.1 DUF2877 domain-containing protein [Paenibacillus sp. ISL-20]
MKFHGTVHSIFDRTVNLKCPNGELYTIATDNVDNAPNTLVTDIDSFSKQGLTIGDQVYAEGDRLYVGKNQAVMLQQVHVWRSKIPSYPEDEEILRSHVAAAQLWIEAHGKAGGMKRSAETVNPFDREMERLLRERSARLLEALSKGEVNLASHYAIQLIGLGPGLTPSGDDFLVGLFAVMNLTNGPLFKIRHVCEQVVAASADRSNPISYMALKKAASGQVRESIGEFMHHMIHGSKTEVISSLSRVLDIGSTSGTDIALGLVNGLKLSIERNGR